MKVSTLIVKLIKFEKKYGDLPVEACGYYEDSFSIDCLKLDKYVITEGNKKTLVKVAHLSEGVHK